MFSLTQLVVCAAVALGMPGDVPSPDTAILAARIGITPEGLAVAGFTQQEAEEIGEDLAGESQHAAALNAAAALVESRAAALAAAESALAASPSSENLAAARTAARNDLAAAQAALAAAPATVRTALLAEANAGKKAKLEVFIAAARFITPPEFKVVSRTDAEWKALEGALRAEARAARRGETLDQAKATLLASVRGNADVIAAKARLDGDLDEMIEALRPD